MDKPVSMGVWLYLNEGQKVTPNLPEVLFWTMVVKDVLTLSVEKSPVKSEGEILYVRPGSAFNTTLAPLEAAFQIPFQTKIASRLKLKNYILQVLRFLQSAKEVEQKYILKELKEKGLLKHGLLDRLFRRKRIHLLPDEYASCFEAEREKALKFKALYLNHIIDIQFDIL